MTDLHQTLRVEDVLDDQRAYYDEWAPGYVHWIQEYMAAVREPLAELIRGAGLAGDVVELACGPGTWTGVLAELADSVDALDGSAEMLHLLAALRLPRVRSRQVDLFDWHPDRTWNAVFASHWLAHVPDQLLAEHLATIAQASDRLIVVDVGPPQKWIERETWEQPGLSLARRTTPNGNQRTIVKHFRSLNDLLACTGAAGWSGTGVEVDSVGAPGIYFADLHRTLS